MTVAIRLYNGFLTLNKPISNLFITSTMKQPKSNGYTDLLGMVKNTRKVSFIN